MPDPGNMLETSFFNFPRVCQCLFDKLLSGIIWGSISKVFSLHFSSPMTSMNRYTLWKDPINSINIRSSDSKRALRFINCTKAIIMNLGCFAAPALAVKLYRKYLRNRTRIKNNKHKSYVINVRLHWFVSQWFNPEGTIWLKTMTKCGLSNHNSHQIPTLLVKMRPVTKEFSKERASGLVRGFSFRVHFHFRVFFPRRCFLKLLLMVQIDWKMIGNNSLMRGSKLYKTLPQFNGSKKGL